MIRETSRITAKPRRKAGRLSAAWVAVVGWVRGAVALLVLRQDAKEKWVATDE
jgi:hypothetical protein